MDPEYETDPVEVCDQCYDGYSLISSDSGLQCLYDSQPTCDIPHCA